MKEKIRKKTHSAANTVRRWAVRGRTIVCNTNGAGGAMDVAIDLVIGVVLALVVLTACNDLFGTNILPGVTNKINSMFNIGS